LQQYIPGAPNSNPQGKFDICEIVGNFFAKFTALTDEDFIAIFGCI